MMLASRAAALVSAGHPSFGGRLDAPRFDAAMMVAFTVMALCYSAACRLPSLANLVRRRRRLYLEVAAQFWSKHRNMVFTQDWIAQAIVRFT